MNRLTEPRESGALHYVVQIRVLDVLAAFDAGGIDYWVDGGWGIDALLGRQTREHRDPTWASGFGHLDRCAQPP